LSVFYVICKELSRIFYNLFIIKTVIFKEQSLLFEEVIGQKIFTDRVRPPGRIQTKKPVRFYMFFYTKRTGLF